LSSFCAFFRDLTMDHDFLGASKRLYNRLCLLVGRSVGLSVRPHIFFRPRPGGLAPRWSFALVLFLIFFNNAKVRNIVRF
jgi:hypothetical protein